MFIHSDGEMQVIWEDIFWRLQLDRRVFPQSRGLVLIPSNSDIGRRIQGKGGAGLTEGERELIMSALKGEA